MRAANPASHLLFSIMDPQELLTAPASTLTRKQRRERAALKRQMSATLPPGYEVGRVRPGVERTFTFEAAGSDDSPLRRGSHVIVRLLDAPDYAVGKP